MFFLNFFTCNRTGILGPRPLSWSVSRAGLSPFIFFLKKIFFQNFKILKKTAYEDGDIF